MTVNRVTGPLPKVALKRCFGAPFGVGSEFSSRLISLAISRGVCGEDWGVYQSTISALENLWRGAQPRTARKLAEALGVTVKVLRGDG
jgi:hypothetical protein